MIDVVHGARRRADDDARRRRGGVHEFAQRMRVLQIFMMNQPHARDSALANRSGTRPLMSRRGKSVQALRAKETRYLRRKTGQGDQTCVKRHNFDVLPVVFTVLAVAFVVAWVLDL